MKAKEARDLGRSGGYLVKVGDDYLGDYRTGRWAYTLNENHAEWFQYLEDARDRAGLVKFLVGMETTIIPSPLGRLDLTPPPPCDCDPLTKGGRMYRTPCCRNVRVRLSDGRELPVTVDEMALLNAIEDLAADLSDDEADVIAAEAGFHLPGGVPRYLS